MAVAATVHKHCAPKCFNHNCPSMDSSRAWTHACACKATQEQRQGGGRAAAAARLIVLSKGFLAGIDAAHRRHEGLARLHLLPAQLLLRSSSRAGWMASRPGRCARKLDSRKGAQLGSEGAAIARLLEPQRKLQRGVLWRLRLAQCSHEWRLAWRGGYRSGSGPRRVLVDRMVEGGLLLLLQPPR